MKKIILYTIIFALMVATLSSCKKDDKSSSPSIVSIVTSGSWRVSYYYDKSKDETSDFNSYTFSFEQNGVLLAASSAGTTYGTLSEKKDDDNGGSHKLFISLGTVNPLSKLNDDWVITAQSSSKMELKDDSNDNEILHFTKN